MRPENERALLFQFDEFFPRRRSRDRIDVENEEAPDFQIQELICDDEARAIVIDIDLPWQV